MKAYHLFAVLVILALVAVVSSLFAVSETEQVVITRLGKPVGRPIVDAGLHFKVPLIDKANYFEKRIMKWDGRPTQIVTKDQTYIWVDTTARWRVEDPLLFLQRVGTIGKAQNLLDGIIDSVVRDHVSNNNLVELVRSEGWEEAKEKLREAGLPETQVMKAGEDQSIEIPEHLLKGREKITREMVTDAARLVPEYGMKLLDIRVKRVNYVESVQKKVFDRMISERKRIAAQYRSEGEGEKAAILGQMDKELAKITSEAFRKSQEIRGKADAEAARVYADAFGKDADFFEFYRTMDFYKHMNNTTSSFVLTTDADIFKYLRSSSGKSGK